ncbi:MAG: hypothetical protein AAB459_02920 [Patescibacteria group bacterium]
MSVKTFKFKIANVLIFITFLLICLLLFANKVSASHAPVIPADPYATQMPLPQYALLADCNHGVFSPALVHWISPLNKPATTTVDVNYGDTSIPLQLNFSSATCFQSSGSVEATNLKVVRVYTAGVNGILNDELGFNIGAGAPVGTYRNTRNAFTYDRPAGFTTSGTVIITLGTKAINQFPGSPNFRCVAATPSPPSTTSLTNFAPCPETAVQFSIFINIINVPSEMRVSTTQSCTTIRGWAIDRDRQLSKLRYVLNMRAPAGGPNTVRVVPSPGRYASDITPQIPAYAWVDPLERNGHGLNVDISGRVAPGTTERFFLYVWGVDKAGVEDNTPQSLEFTIECPAPLARPPTGNIIAACNPASKRLDVTVNNISDPDITDPTVRARTQFTVIFYIRHTGSATWSQVGSRQTAAGQNSVTYQDSTHFDTSYHDVRAIIRGVDAFGNLAAPDSNPIESLNIPPCIVACNANDTQSPEPNGNMVFVVRITNNNSTAMAAALTEIVVQNARTGAFEPGLRQAANPSLPMDLDVNNPPPSSSTLSIPVGATATYTSGNISTTGLEPGRYLIHVAFAGSTYASCGSFVIGHKPYLKVFGGEVFAGSEDGSPTTSCPGWDPDRPKTIANDPNQPLIDTFSATSGVGRGGSATNLAAYALDSIYEFQSALFRSSAPLPASGLYFANFGVSDNGGSLGVIHCPFDYFGKKPSVNGDNMRDVTSTRGNAGNRQWLNVLDTFFPAKQDSFLVSGDITLGEQDISDGSSCVAQRQINLYVEGNVTLTGNIRASTAARACLQQAPRLLIVAKGNIRIGSDVTRVDGILIAQPNGSPNSGTIYTCREDNGSRISASDLYDDCNNQLVINGALAGHRIKWLRTYGTVRNSSGSNEYPGTSAGPLGGRCENAGDIASANNPRVQNICAAEIVIHAPDAYLSGPPQPSQSFGVTYDYIAALPPLL